MKEEDLDRIRAVYDKAIKSPVNTTLQELAVIHNSQAEFVKSMWEMFPLLVTEIDRLTRERDAAVADIYKFGRSCDNCKHGEPYSNVTACGLNKAYECGQAKNHLLWQWRGVQE